MKNNYAEFRAKLKANLFVPTDLDNELIQKAIPMMKGICLRDIIEAIFHGFIIWLIFILSVLGVNYGLSDSILVLILSIMLLLFTAKGRWETISNATKSFRDINNNDINIVKGRIIEYTDFGNHFTSAIGIFTDKNNHEYKVELTLPIECAAYTLSTFNYDEFTLICTNSDYFSFSNLKFDPEKLRPLYVTGVYTA